MFCQLRLCPVSLRLRIQRLKWFQNIMRWPLSNAQLIDALFGIAEWEEEGFVDREGYMRGEPREWWTQFMADVSELARVAEFPEVVPQVHDFPAALFCDPDVRFMFLSADPSVLFS
eukprot:8750910-Pyramimonas_sp.AAC.1